MTENVMVSDPAPGVQGEAAPGLNTGLTEGAGDGFGCLPSPDKAQASTTPGLLTLPCWGIEVSPSENYPWNGWTCRREDTTWSFEAGVYFPVLQHLIGCRRCRRKNGLTVKTVKDMLKRLEEEWELWMRRRREERTTIVVEKSCLITLIRQIEGETEKRTYRISGYLEREGNWMAYIHTAGFAWTYHGNVQRTMEYLTSLGLNAKQQ
jgi:hypothetical protein